MARIGLTVVGVSALAVLAACGGKGFADESADTIVTTAKADMGDLTSVKVTGDLTTGGQAITIDLQADSGGDCTGTIGIGGGSAELLGVGDQTWMRPDDAFWKAFAGSSADQVRAVVGDKWVVVPGDQAAIKQLCDADQLLDQMLKDEGPQATYTKNGTDTLNGDDVVKIDSKDSVKGTSTGYVLVDDPHYLVRIEKTSGSDSGTVTFSAFDEKVDVSAPADGDVVDLSTLGG